jgi:hypothetical protein
MHVYERRLRLGDIGDCPLGALFACWKRYPSAVGSLRMLPGRRALDSISIEPVLGRVNIVAVQRKQEGFRFVWRRHGVDGAVLHGDDLTGKDTSTLHPLGYRELIERHYGEAAMLGEPTLYELESIYEHHLSPRYYRRLVLPLATDGRTVDMLVTAWDANLRGRIQVH